MNLFTQYGVLSTLKFLDGSTSSKAAPSAEYIYNLTGTTTDGLYWIDIPGVGPKQIYCLMSSGGWMRAANFATSSGSTYGWSNTSFWQTQSVVNETTFSYTTTSKYAIWNTFEATNFWLKDSSGTNSYSGITTAKTCSTLLNSANNTTIGALTINAVYASSYSAYGTNYFRIGRASGNLYYTNIGCGSAQSWGCSEQTSGDFGVNSYNCTLSGFNMSLYIK